MASSKLVLIFLLSLLFLHTASALPIGMRRRRPDDTSSAASQPLSQQTRQQPSLSSVDLAPALVLPGSTLTNLTTLPSNCALYNSAQDGECKTVFEATNVTYDDCGSPVTVCRCSDAELPLDQAVQDLGRVPVGLRRYIGNVVLVPRGADGQTRAYTLTNGDIHIFGAPEVDTWVHESAHAYDWATGTPITESQGWLQAVQSDSCVPDDYAATSAVEDFAQQVVLKVYTLTHNQTLPPGFTPDCMRHQLQFMNMLPVFDPATLFGNTCAFGDAQFVRHYATSADEANGTRVNPYAAGSSSDNPSGNNGSNDAAANDGLPLPGPPLSDSLGDNGPAAAAAPPPPTTSSSPSPNHRFDSGASGLGVFTPSRSSLSFVVVGIGLGLSFGSVSL